MELKKTLKSIFNQFKTEGSFKSYQTFSSGHINDTYLIITDKTPYYILQKLNGKVFTKAVDVIENKIKIANFLVQKKGNTIQFIQTKNNKNYLIDNEGNFWNMNLYIAGTKTFLVTTSNKIAYQAGKATGEFLSKTTNFKSTLIDVLPNFHSMSYRFLQFKEALLKASTIRKQKSKEWIHFALSNKKEMMLIDLAINKHKIPLRVTHNDTKISNILFNSNGKAICLIDLDTVMFGAIHFDYGDALRTISNTSDEDEKDISKIEFNLDYFKNYTLGFLSTLKNTLSKAEIDYLPMAPKIMTFIMGLRFLTDYLNNDVYYKKAYTNHNLDRAKNQFTLVKRIKENQQQITDYINLTSL